MLSISENFRPAGPGGPNFAPFNNRTLPPEFPKFAPRAKFAQKIFFAKNFFEILNFY